MNIILEGLAMTAGLMILAVIISTIYTFFWLRKHGLNPNYWPAQLSKVQIYMLILGALAHKVHTILLLRKAKKYQNICPYCGHGGISVNILYTKVAPSPGDYGVCYMCKKPFRFALAEDGKLSPRQLTEDDELQIMFNATLAEALNEVTRDLKR